MNTNMTLSVLGLYNYDDSIFSTMQLPEGVDRDILTDNILMECAELEVLYPDSDFMKTAINRWSAKEVNVWSKLNELWNTEIDVSNEYDYKRIRTANLSHSKTGTETDVKTGNKELTKTGSETDILTKNGTESNNRTGSITDTGSDNRTANLTDTNQVSAYNSSDWENREKNTETGTDNHALNNTQTFNNLTDSVSFTNRSDNNTKTFTNRKDTEKYNDITDTTTHNTSVSETGTDTITETGHKTPVYELIKQASEVAIYNIYDYITESFKERFCLMIY